MKTRNLGLFLWLFSSLIFGVACKKHVTLEATKPNTNLRIEITHLIDNIPLLFDSINYANKGGNKYSVTRLNYYISDIILQNNKGETFNSNSTYYVNGRNASNVINLLEMPTGNYTSMRFLIGLNPTQNTSNSLENNVDNLNMAWPEVIGGGYHFLKFEGYYLDSARTKQGFTMHLGTNDMLVAHQSLPISLLIEENKPDTLGLQMNLNEWFQNPHTWNFNVDGNYTMAIPALMTLLKNNGTDVFTIK